jgi:hypothetical protein
VRIINPDTLEEMPHGTDGEVNTCAVRVCAVLRWCAVLVMRRDSAVTVDHTVL